MTAANSVVLQSIKFTKEELKDREAGGPFSSDVVNYVIIRLSPSHFSQSRADLNKPTRR